MGGGPLGLGILGGGDDDKSKLERVEALGHDLGGALFAVERELNELLFTLLEIERVARPLAVDIKLQLQRVQTAGSAVEQIRDSLESFNGFFETTKLRLKGQVRGLP